MKNLKSLESFKEEKLKVSFLGNVKGGLGDTAGGQACLKDGVGDTGAGCYNFTSDTEYERDGRILTSHNGSLTEVDLDCSIYPGNTGGGVYTSPGTSTYNP